MISVIKQANVLFPQQAHAVKKHDVYVKNHKVLGFDLGIAASDTIEAAGKTLLPQFFNIHTHLGESLYNIHLDHPSVCQYIKETNKINDGLSVCEQNELWKRSAEKTIHLMQSEHTIGFCAGRSAEIAISKGMLTMAGYPLMSSNKLKSYFLNGLSGYLEYRDRFTSPAVSVGIFLHSLYYADMGLLELAENCFPYADFLIVHVSEDATTRQMEISMFHKKPIFQLDQCGLLTTKTIIVHGGFLDEDELELISRRGACIVICPCSNKFLHTRPVDLNKLNALGISWLIGTDGFITGGGLSLLAQIQMIKQCNLKIKNTALLDAITVRPGKLFKRGLYTGSVAPGVKASFILVHDDFVDVDESLTGFFNGCFQTEDLHL